MLVPRAAAAENFSKAEPGWASSLPFPVFWLSGDSAAETRVHSAPSFQECPDITSISCITGNSFAAGIDVPPSFDCNS